MQKFCDSLYNDPYAQDTQINEAAFSVKNAKKVAEAYGALFGKEFGGKFIPVYSEWYQKQRETGTGIKMVNTAGARLRINFSDRMLKFAAAPRNFIVLSSIDYWSPANKNDTCPTTTCYFEESVNVVQIWKQLAGLIRSGREGKYTIKDLLGIKESCHQSAVPATDMIDEDLTKGTMGSRRSFLKGRGEKQVIGNQYADFVQYVKDNGLEDAWEQYIATIEAGKPERNQTSSDIDQTQKELDEHKYCDPRTIFKDIEGLTYTVAHGIIRSFICCGMGGVGKTWHITHVMEDEVEKAHVKYRYHSGMKVAVTSFYREVFLNRDAINVFDEADDILQNSDIIVMLKPVLDTSGKNAMEYLTNTESMRNKSDAEIEDYSAYCDEVADNGGNVIYSNKPVGGPAEEGDVPDTARIPSKFFFSGGMIFITNMPASKMDQAIISRSAFIDVQLRAEDVLWRIFDILLAQVKMGKYTMAALKKFSAGMGYDVEFTSDSFTIHDIIGGNALSSRKKQLTVRTATNALKMIDFGVPNWESLVQYI